ncbi:hypothetical protein E5676_scaffold392G00610 [Cucumis melo var. makuwa]|uniref:Uncharacterized protein n=1 Tax=Cucumis melo var. makuwa TaxID=1194695 RepID=A0A5D3DC01_CUCMM|nr:hypothetical protein E6C27_scaffold238G001440 [Cucumis melo var. makuwa]TYK21095.1 hypothetical protein E5676_scaffold392G00610 [Cucumis melo var. makuwa]
MIGDPTSTKGRSGIFHQIHYSSKSDRTTSSCFTVIDPILLGDDRAFAIKSTILVEAIGRLRCASPSTIQLLLGDDRAFTVKSTALIGAIRHLHRASQSTIQLLLGDDRAFDIRSIVLIHRLNRSDWTSLPCFAVSDLTSIDGQSGIYRQIHRPSRSNQTYWRDRGEAAPSSLFGEMRGGRAASALVKPKVFKLA